METFKRVIVIFSIFYKLAENRINILVSSARISGIKKCDEADETFIAIILENSVLSILSLQKINSTSKVRVRQNFNTGNPFF